MGYCSISQVESILAQALTSSTTSNTTKVSLWTIGNTRDMNSVSDDVVNQYIRWADDEIDSNLTVLYKTPLKKVSNGEWELEQDIDPYNPYTVVVSDATNLVPGDEILIISTAFNPPIKEAYIVAEIINSTEFTTTEPIFTDFPAGEETRVVRIGFNPAIVLMSSRLTSANIWDKYFSAQASPDVSEYGNTLRSLAQGQMTDILNGVVVLHGQDRIGNRFANSELYDRYSLLRRDGNDSREVKQK